MLNHIKLLAITANSVVCFCVVFAGGDTASPVLQKNKISPKTQFVSFFFNQNLISVFRCFCGYLKCVYHIPREERRLRTSVVEWLEIRQTSRESEETRLSSYQCEKKLYTRYNPEHGCQPSLEIQNCLVYNVEFRIKTILDTLCSVYSQMSPFKSVTQVLTEYNNNEENVTQETLKTAEMYWRKVHGTSRGPLNKAHAVHFIPLLCNSACPSRVRSALCPTR